MALIGHSWIAHGPKQDGAEILAKHFEGSGRKSDALFEIFLGSPIEFDEFQACAEFFVHTAQHAHRLARHIDTDTITGNDCNSFHYDLVSELYSATSACKCDSSSLAKSIKSLRPFASGICSAKSV